jgi:GntR family transcriptional repressor for pyruvate dehydrogenase complex
MTTSQEGVPQSGFWKIRVERVSEKVEAQLRKLIAEGSLKVGDRLPSERDLAEQMGVSRVSVREALQRMELQGMLATVHGGGSIVRNITEQELRRPIERFIEEDKRRVLELAELRAFMETWAAREAARHRTEEELETIGAYFEEMRRDFEKGVVRYEVDFKFHTEIAAATHNSIYMHWIDNVYSLLSYSIKVHREEVFVRLDAQERILSQHRHILQAIRDGNPEAAEAAMKEHQAFVLAEYTRHFVSS